MRTVLRAVTVAVTAALIGVPLGASTAAASEAPPVVPGTRSVLFVANNWDGTADVIDPDTFETLKRLDVIPDIDERMAEIRTDPERLAFFLLIQQFVGEGNNQYADDMFTSHDGRYVYVSRPSLADVVSIHLGTGEIEWRLPIEGQRSDHMAISQDGTRLIVSDSTERKAHVIDPIAGEFVGEFESGDSPHENNYSKDGSRIFHASIGLVYTPLDQPEFDTTKGDRWFQIVDAETYEVTARHDIGEILEDHGHEDFSSAVRPMAISPDEQTAYFQLSFFHGFVVFDISDEQNPVPLDIVDLPISEEAANTPREQYLLDSAHHGLALNPEGTKLCVAGTMSDYAAIVSTADYSHRITEVGSKPYWSTNSADGRYCFVSVSGDDRVVVLDYASEEEVARIDVGDHPQRMRMGLIRTEFVEDEQEPEAAPPAQDEESGPAPAPAAAPAPTSQGRAAPTLPATGGPVALAAVATGLVALGVAARRRDRSDAADPE
jgi:DNA-binding beta-propeller fold protein YncE